MYCGHTCSLVAVHVQAAAAAFKKLFNSPELRRQMGEAGRARAQAVYDWKPIIGQYEALWAKQTELRLVAKAQADKNGIKPLAHPWPARMDPFHAFASYPTQALTPQTELALVDADADTAITRALAYRQLAMVDFAKFVLPTEDEIASVLDAASPPQTAQALLAGIAQERQAFVFRSLAWLLKLGVLKVVS
jgi:starch synthase